MSIANDDLRISAEMTPYSRTHLERLMASWGLLADLSFSDLLLLVPFHQEGKPPTDREQFVVLGQMRPTTSQTLFGLDLVGHIVERGEYSLAFSAFRLATIQREEHPDNTGGADVRYEYIPVRSEDEVVAVLTRVWSPTSGRLIGSLESVYQDLFEQFAAMVTAGRYPFADVDGDIEEAPRVGDGVLVLDIDQRVSFASPNAVNALHRLGIVSSIERSTLSDLGISNAAVSTAFTEHAPGVEELERAPDVVVLFRCIPLLTDEGVTGAALLVRDVTDLRRRDRLLVSKDAAIREVHHRVKNNLQTISSLLRLQSRRVEDRVAKVALLEAERRIRTIALVHEILSRDPGEQVPFAQIVPALVDLALDANVLPAAIEVNIEGEAGDFDAEVATPLAVVVAELLQNAVEHAFIPTPAEGPLIALRFTRSTSLLIVEVRDNGVGFPGDFDINETRSLGLAIVRDLVQSQLGGKISATNDNGATVRLVVPLHDQPKSDDPSSTDVEQR